MFIWQSIAASVHSATCGAASAEKATAQSVSRETEVLAGVRVIVPLATCCAGSQVTAYNCRSATSFVFQVTA